MQFLSYSKVNNAVNEQTVYADCVGHCKDYTHFWSPGDRVTSAHECTHGVNADLRNGGIKRIAKACLGGGGKTMMGALYVPLATTKYNCFYVLQDRAIKIQEPACRKQDAIKHIPESLRFYRYKTYVSGQNEWDAQPLYLWDEWVAYQNGADCAIQDNVKDGADWIFGPTEFITYGIATIMSAPEPLDQTLKDFAVWMLNRVMDIYARGKDKLPWPEMEKCLGILKTGPEAQPIRDFMLNKLGWSFDNPTPGPNPLDWVM